MIFCNSSMDQLAHVLKEIITEQHYHHHRLHHHHHHHEHGINDNNNINTAIDNLPDDSSTLFNYGDEDDDYMAIKHKIIAHPNFHDLLIAYVNCQKVGAPPQVVKKLDDLIHASCSFMQKKKYSSLSTLLHKDSVCKSNCDDDRHHHHTSIHSCDQYDHLHHQINSSGTDSGDPELDDFMDAYCGLLRRYHEELSKPLDEAMAFLADIKLQVSKNTDNDEEDDDYDQYDPRGGLMEDLMDAGLRIQFGDISDGEDEEDDDNDDESYNYGEYKG